MTLVFNASPIIVLAKAGLLEAILPLGEPVKVPQAVVDEILRANDVDDPAKLGELRPGAGVIAKIHCGKASISYVWLRDLISAIRTRLLF